MGIAELYLLIIYIDLQLYVQLSSLYYFFLGFVLHCVKVK